MHTVDAARILAEQAAQGRVVFHRRDFPVLFPDDTDKTLEAGLKRLVEAGLLVRAARSVYVYPYTRTDGYLLERIARALRRPEYNYVSLEAALSEWGVISQMPIDYLTVMTTGRRGVFRTPWGTIEFTHTTRRPREIVIGSVQAANRPLWLAHPHIAWEDLRNVGRNTHLVDLTALEEVEADMTRGDVDAA